MDGQVSFGRWLEKRRKALDLTREELAQKVGCSISTLRKIESDERRPSKQLAELIADELDIRTEERATFLRIARGELAVERMKPSPSLPDLSLLQFSQPFSDSIKSTPVPPTPLIGRETELIALREMIHDPQCRLITLFGPGGIGKTRLAIETAIQQNIEYSQAVAFVSLAALSSVSLIVHAIADALGFSFRDSGEPKTQLIDYLREKNILLVLDNFEHLLDGVDLLMEVIRFAPKVKLLCTSREQLNVQGEWVFEVRGLPIPDAEALFVNCAHRVLSDFSANEANRQTIIQICRLIEGMPLAIELAATWVSILPIKEIVEEIASNLDFLTTAMKNIPERHRSLRAVFEHSWRLLSDEERNVLCCLAVFRGGFTRQAAEQVASASLAILMSLLSKSLLVRREDGRYDLHELIRQCALERLHDSGYFDETCHQHLAYFVSLALEAHTGLRSAQMTGWLRRIEQEHDNIRSALEWAFTPTAPSERVERGLSLVSSIDRYWASGLIHEGIIWLERGLQANHTVSLASARALRTAGVLYNIGDDEQAATRSLQESLAISRQLNDEVCQANALDTLGDIAWHYGDFPKAKAYYAESLELFQKIGEPCSIGLSLASTGRLHVDYGYYPEAEQLLTEGLSLLENVSDLRGRGYCLNALGRVALLQGNMKLAAVRFRQALHLNYELGYLVDISELLHEIAVVEAILGDQSRAVLILAASNALEKKIGVHYPVDDLVDRQAPAGWLQRVSFSEEWAKGEMLSMDQAVAYALEEETG